MVFNGLDNFLKIFFKLCKKTQNIIILKSIAKDVPIFIWV